MPGTAFFCMDTWSNEQQAHACDTYDFDQSEHVCFLIISLFLCVNVSEAHTP